MSKIIAKIEATAGDNVPAEISYWKRNKAIGYWAYGTFDPAMPYNGRTWLQRTTASIQNLMKRITSDHPQTLDKRS